VSRARFIAAARLEFLAEVIYYGEAEADLGARFTAAVEEAAMFRVRVSKCWQSCPNRRLSHG